MTTPPPTQYIVTIKLPRNPEHDPTNKIPGICPAFGGYCTDVTGAHHTALTQGEYISAEHVILHYQALGFHVTRVERTSV